VGDYEALLFFGLTPILRQVISLEFTTG